MVTVRRNHPERRHRPSSSADIHGSYESARMPPKPGENDFYDSSDDEKEHHDDSMCKGACSLGQFFLDPCRCMYNVARKTFRTYQNPKFVAQLENSLPPSLKIIPRLVIWCAASCVLGVLAIILFLAIIITAAEIFNLILGPPNLRPPTDRDLNVINIMVPLYDPSKRHHDIGGWLFPHKFFLPRASIEVELAGTDSGGLLFKSTAGKMREIDPKDSQRFEEYRDKVVNTKGSTRHMSKKMWFDDELEDKEIDCQRVNWKILYKPNCNAAHEISLDRDNVDPKGVQRPDESMESYYISHGYFRDVWLLNQVDREQKMVLKLLRYKHDAAIGTMRSILNDALIMERLSKSPLIIDMYSHCGTTILAEAIPHEVEQYVVPGSGYIKQKDLKDEHELKPRNDYTAEEKLDMALQMAESLADLHGFEDGVIVHDDVQLCQWLRQPDGKLKLGDFNRATVMDYDRSKEGYCKFDNGAGYGNYRAPEEFAAKSLDEKIDIFSFGNNIYALITGLWVFYENEDDGVVQKKLIGQEKAFIDPRYRERGSIERGLIEIMERCWEYDPDKRIDIFEIVRMLRKLKKKTADKSHQ